MRSNPTLLLQASRVAGLCLLLAAGCAAPASVSRQMMANAVRLFSMGDAELALEEAREAVDRSPSDLEVHWIYQDLLLADGQRDAAIEEYFDRLRRRQGDVDLRILFERVGRGGKTKEEGLKRLLRLERKERWVRLALAEASLEQGDPEEAERWIHEGPGIPAGAASLSIHLQSALAAHRHAEAKEIATEILSDNCLLPPPSAALIYAHLLRGETARAVDVGKLLHDDDDRSEPYRAAGIARLRARSYVVAVQRLQAAERRGGVVEPGLLLIAYHGAIQDRLARGSSREAERLVDEILDRFPRSGRLLALKALILDRQGRGKEAIETIREAVEISPTSSEVVRRARRLFVDMGMPVEAYRVWRGAIPSGLESSPANRLSPRFREVYRWSREAEAAPHNAAVAVSLATAYSRAGWMAEATSQYRRAVALSGGALVIEPALQEMAVFRRVVRRIRAYLRTTASDEAGIEEIVERIAGIVNRETGESFSSEGLVESYLFFGEEVNLLTRPGSPLLRYFLRFNHYLDIRETGGDVEVRLMELVGWSEREERIFGRTYRWQRVTVDRSPIRHPGDGSYWVAGTTSWSGRGFVVDLETIRSSLFPANVDPATAEVTGAPAEGDDRLAIRYSPELRTRLLRDALERAGTPAALLHREVENVAQHEIGHIVDFAGLVPWGRYPFRHIGILISHLFSRDAIASRYQKVAETFAIARSPDPRLALLTSLDWLRAEGSRPGHLFLLFGDDPSARDIYIRTSKEILGGVVAEIAERAESFPEVDGSGPILGQVDRIGDEALREIAWRLYDDTGGRR